MLKDEEKAARLMLADGTNTSTQDKGIATLRATRANNAKADQIYAQHPANYMYFKFDRQPLEYTAYATYVLRDMCHKLKLLDCCHEIYPSGMAHAQRREEGL